MSDNKDLEADETELILNKDISSSFQQHQVNLLKYSPKFSRITAASEFVASFLLSFIGICAIWVSSILTDGGLTADRLFFIGLAYGMTYGALMYSLSIDGTNVDEGPNIRHMNPALTFSLWCAQKIGFRRMLLLLAMQCTGGAGGAACAYYCMPYRTHKLYGYETLEGAHEGHAFGMGIISSFMFFLVMYITVFGTPAQISSQRDDRLDEQQPQTVHELNCIIATVTLTVTATLSSAITGGFINPLFEITLIIITQTFTWAAIISPFLGGLLAMLGVRLFRWIRVRRAFTVPVVAGNNNALARPAAMYSAYPNASAASADPFFRSRVGGL